MNRLIHFKHQNQTNSSGNRSKTRRLGTKRNAEVNSSDWGHEETIGEVSICTNIKRQRHPNMKICWYFIIQGGEEKMSGFLFWISHPDFPSESSWLPWIPFSHSQTFVTVYDTSWSDEKWPSKNKNAEGFMICSTPGWPSQRSPGSSGSMYAPFAASRTTKLPEKTSRRNPAVERTTKSVIRTS